MKQAINLTTGNPTSAVENEIRTAFNVNAVPRLIADWNWNRYANPTAYNTPSEDTDGFDIEVFPIESIIEPLRPTKGVAKALVGQAVASEGYVTSHTPRFYSSDREDTYKYWTSPVPTNSSGNFPNHTDGITVVRPTVEYDRVVQANKIVIKLENTWASPNSYSIRIKTTLAGSYGAALAGGNNAIANDGTVTLYYNGTAWVSTRPEVLVSTGVAGIQVRVNSLTAGRRRDGNIMGYYVGDTWVNTNGQNSNFNLIAIEAHYEVDLSDRLISVSDTFDFSEKSQLYPIGTITTNTAEITLSNEDGIFNSETTGEFEGLIEPNCEFKLDYIFDINSTLYSVQQFVMYANPWTHDEATASISLDDYSKYLKEIKPRAFMVEGKTSSEIVWRVLDSVGFVNYNIDEEDLIDDNAIPVFWTSGEETVWEILDELARATQTAIYIDSYGVLQVKRREAAFKETETVDWNLLGENVGNDLADIIAWSPSGELEANKIDVRYADAKWKVNSQGYPAMNKVWEPENESLVIRSAALKRGLDDDGTLFFIDQKDIAIWPYTGYVQIGGEILEYEGKQFVYYTYDVDRSGGTPTFSNEQKHVAVAKDQDHADRLNRKTPIRKRHKNHFNGGFKIKERGIWNTEPQNHPVDINHWDAKMELTGKTSPTTVNNPKGLVHVKRDSLLRINTPVRMKDENDIFWATRGGVNSTGYKAYGMRMHFNKDKQSSTQVAGIAFNLTGARENGYYVEVRLSSSMDAKRRKVLSEIIIYSRINGRFKVLKKGAATAIGRGIWYDIDVYHTGGTANEQTLSVWVNGQKVATATTNATTKHGASGRFALYARGRTNVDFEYMYAVNYANINEPIDGYGFYDLKYGAMRGNRWQREYVWELNSRHRKFVERPSEKEKKKRRNLYVFDEFGPYAHEVRKFDVKFDPNPVRYSYLFNSNEWYSAIIQYAGNPFGSEFILVNTSRENAILHGEDNLIYAGAESPVNQVCVVLGQTLELADEETVTRKNEPAIRARGEITVELTSPWIQSEAMAKSLAIWMGRHWSEAVDEVEVTIFGNPLLELGDLVDVTYDRVDADPSTHKYWITGIRTGFDAGITTSLTLRRRRLASELT